MVEVTLTRDSNDLLTQVLATGHAEYQKKGSDVVCSAISVLLQTAYVTFCTCSGVKANLFDDGNVFRLSLSLFDKNQKERFCGISSFLITGLFLIRQDYSDYINIMEEKNGTS